jgi:hypothetical protein
MTDSTTTTFSNKCFILGDLWLNYRDDEQFMDFITYNDVGLPLAYLIDSKIVEVTEVAKNLVDQTWDLLLNALGVDDSGFQNVDEILDEAEGLG